MRLHNKNVTTKLFILFIVLLISAYPIAKKLGEQDCKFAGISDSNQFGFLCPYSLNAIYRFEQKLIAQNILTWELKLKYMSILGLKKSQAV